MEGYVVTPNCGGCFTREGYSKRTGRGGRAGRQAAMRIHLYCRRRALSCDVYEAANSMWVRFVNTNNATPHHKSHSSDSAHVVVCAKHTHTAREWATNERVALSFSLNWPRARSIFASNVEYSLRCRDRFTYVPPGPTDARSFICPLLMELSANRSAMQIRWNYFIAIRSTCFGTLLAPSLWPLKHEKLRQMCHSVGNCSVCCKVKLLRFDIELAI